MNGEQIVKLERAVKEHEEALAQLKSILKEARGEPSPMQIHAPRSTDFSQDQAWRRIFGR